MRLSPLSSPLSSQNGLPVETDTDSDITTAYQYDSSGRMVTMTAYDAKGAGNGVTAEATKYLYTSAVDASLQTAEVDPDSTDVVSQDPNTLDWSITSGTDHTSTTYDLMGRTVTATDERGVVHTYSYDSAGRLSADTVTSFGPSGAVDETVNEIATAYDDVGRVQTVTSLGLVGSVETVLNQVEEAYDGWGNVVQEWQSHTGAVDTGSTPSVQYTYSDGAVGGVAQYVRLTDLIYPNGRDVQYDYTNAVDEVMSRITSIGTVGESTPESAYTYLGADTIASESYPQAQVKLDYSADNFAAWDRFGRVLEQVWSSYGVNSGNAGTLDGYSYTYDRAGNRTSQINLTDAALSETFSYDGLDRLTQYSVNGVTQQTWSLDSLGNDLSAGTYDAANEETPTTGSSGYDLAGNMTTLTSGDTAVYDAWNRMVEVDSASGVVEKYAYDGTNRRIQIFSDFSGSTPGTVTDDYQAGQQVVESDVTTGGVRSGGHQYLWSRRYIDAPILRDTLTTDGSGVVAAQRIFYMGDANYNVTGVVKLNESSGNWEVAERYSYTPYGVVTYRNADWSVAGSSADSNTILYTGKSLDLATSLYYYRARYYDALLERFIGRDPIAADINLYRYCANNPVMLLDPLGLEVVTVTIHPPGAPGIDVDVHVDRSCTDKPTKVGQEITGINQVGFIISCEYEVFTYVTDAKSQSKCENKKKYVKWDYTINVHTYLKIGLGFGVGGGTGTAGYTVDKGSQNVPVSTGWLECGCCDSGTTGN